MTALHVVSLACLGVFLLAVIYRFVRIARLPVHVRWELYPVAHEKGRARYGGSYFEELNWWTKPRETSVLGELRVMVPEILLLAGVRHRNRSHWYRSFPFHFGLYLVVATTLLLTVNGVIEAAGGAGFGRLLARLTAGLGYAGFGLGLLGAAALFLRRLGNPEYREFTKPTDFANLLFFTAAFAVALAAQVLFDPDFSRMRGFFAGFFGAPAPGLAPLQGLQVVLLSLLAAYVPLTHMSHFFTKYFLYHDIRWNDTPLAPGSRLEKRMQEVLELKPTWSAPHIRGDGRKTWVDVATSAPGDDAGEKGGAS